MTQIDKIKLRQEVIDYRLLEQNEPGVNWWLEKLAQREKDLSAEIVREIEGIYKNTDEGTMEELPDQLIFNSALDKAISIVKGGE